MWLIFSKFSAVARKTIAINRLWGHTVSYRSCRVPKGPHGLALIIVLWFSLGGCLAVGVKQACRNARSSVAVAAGDNYSNQRKVVPMGPYGFLQRPVGFLMGPMGLHIDNCTMFVFPLAVGWAENL